MTVLTSNIADARSYEIPTFRKAADVPGVPEGTVMTKEFAVAFSRDVYIWGWPIVNAFHRRQSFATAPEPGLTGGILPVAPTGYVSMLTDYVTPDQRWVAHPN